MNLLLVITVFHQYLQFPSLLDLWEDHTSPTPDLKHSPVTRFGQRNVSSST